MDVHEGDPETDERASSIQEGWVIREYGDDEWHGVIKRGDHGDTVLVTYDDGVETTFDIDEVIARFTPDDDEEEPVSDSVDYRPCMKEGVHIATQRHHRAECPVREAV